ncbi:MAG: hypothetical protein ABIH86_05880 [Planctomycetota bacterium]
MTDRKDTMRTITPITVLLLLLTFASTGEAMMARRPSDQPDKPKGPVGAPVVMPPQAPSGLTTPSMAPWENLGVGGGGCIYWPSYAPTDPNTVITSCDMGGNYLSVDGGLTWGLIKGLSRCAMFSFHPTDPKTILAADHSCVKKTTDGGVTWKTTPGQVGRSSPDCNAQAVLFDPDFPDLAWCSMGMWQNRFGNGGIEYSTNGGDNFNRAKGTEGIFAWYIAVDPATPKATRRVLAATEHGVLESDDAGKTWTKNAAWSFGKSCGIAILSPLSRDKAIYLACSATQLYRSEDRGKSWKAVEGVTKTGGYSMEAACSPYQDKIAYATAAVGVWATVDGGLTWKLTGDKGLTTRGWREDYKDFKHWANNVNGGVGGLGVPAGDPKICMAVTDMTASITRDGGETWDVVYTVPNDGGKSFTGYGLEVTKAYDSAFKPGDPNTLFLCYTDIGGFRSDDYGRSFNITMDGAQTHYGNGYAINLWNTMYAILFDPASPNTAWMTHSSKHNLPFETGTDDYYRGYVCISNNGGKTWTTSSNGLPVVSITDIKMDIDSPVGKRRLYAACLPGGVYRSDDNGKTWSEKNKGLPGNLRAWRLAVGAPEPAAKKGGPAIRKVYVVALNDGPTGAFVSADGGENWSKIEGASAYTNPYDIAADPQDPNRLYLTNYIGGYDGGQGGFFLSEDGGKSWRATKPCSDAKGITVSPFDPNVVFFAANKAGIFYSEDKGKTFNPVPDWHAAAGAKRVTVDAADPNILWVATENVGFMRGPWKDAALAKPIRGTPSGSVAVAYQNAPKAKPAETLNLRFERTGTIPSKDPARANELRAILIRHFIAAASAGFNGKIDVELYGRIKTVTVSEADEDFLIVKDEGNEMELEWLDMTPANFQAAMLALARAATPDGIRDIADFFARSGNIEAFWETRARSKQLTPEHDAAVRALIILKGEPTGEDGAAGAAGEGAEPQPAE